MMSGRPLCVAIFWHMHQPDYGNVQTGEVYLPWTRFHAAKDYYDMGVLLERTPGLRLTINVVPSLMDQLDAYGSGTARETYAELTRHDATELHERQRLFLLRAFFQLPHRQMVHPYPRYRELLERRGPSDENGEFVAGAKRFSTRDYRDLQMWFNLSWCGQELRRDPEVAAMIRKGQDFTEAEKSRLLEIQFAFAGRILPLYRRLMDEKRLELSVSPYYHPIIPLLCDNRSAREALPGLPLPATPFAFPSDAREQIRLARKRYQQAFGRPPAGMWPSEGAVSDATAALVREAALRWIATDEDVLSQSLEQEVPARGCPRRGRDAASIAGEMETSDLASFFAITAFRI
jgi:alpha-amylase/alpha-mannosidase (GH57 family)